MEIRKILFWAVTLLATATSVRSQGTTSADGTIDFTSQANPIDYSFGGPVSGGKNVFVQLYWAPIGSASYEPVSGVPVGFLSGARAGFWDASSESVVTTPGLAGGSQVMVIARVGGGTIVDSSGNGAVYGQSNPILITTGNAGAPATAPASISDMASFSVTEAIPEPSMLVLGIVGAVGLFRNHRK